MESPQISDKELIRQYLSGKETAFEVLMKRYQEKVYTYVLYNVRDKALADDIFQDTFIKVVATLKKGKYNEEGKFLPWVMRIAHNLMIDHFRRSNKMPTTSGGDDFDIFDVIPCDRKSVEQDIVSTQIRKDVKNMIKYLPKDQKEVLMMRIYYEMSFKEIAERTNVSINTALGRMRYALINLRKIAEENNMVLRA